MVRGDVVPIADWAGTLVAIARIDVCVFVFVIACHHWAPHCQEVFTQAPEQAALWVLAREHPRDLTIQQQRRLVDPQTKPYPPDTEAVAHDVSVTGAVWIGRLGSTGA